VSGEVDRWAKFETWTRAAAHSNPTADITALPLLSAIFSRAPPLAGPRAGQTYRTGSWV